MPHKGTPYHCTQTLGKAVKRAQMSLPVSPAKRLCVIEKLAEKAGLPLGTTSSSNQRSNALSDEVKSAVKAFYLSNDTTWQAPGRKDRIIIREVGSDGKVEKRTEQTRYMLMSLREAHTKYGEEHPSQNIGFSKFCELRPQNIKCLDHLPHHVCVCAYHENVRLLLLALKDHTPLTAEFDAFRAQVTCDPNAKECLTGECTKCVGMIDELAPADGDVPIRYHQWQSNERTEKVEVVSTARDAFLELKKKLKPFLMHTYG